MIFQLTDDKINWIEYILIKLCITIII